MGLLDEISTTLSSYLPEDPQKREAVTTGLLSMGAAMLGAPTQNFGRALGAGIQGGVTGYNTAYEMGQKTELQKAQLATNKLGLEKSRMIMDAARGMLGGDGLSQPSQAVASTPGGSMLGAPAAPSQNNPLVAAKPMASWPMLDAAAPDQVPAPAPAGPQAAPQRPMFGNIPNKLAGFGLLTDPGKLFELAASQYAPTDVQKTMTALGMVPGSKEWNDTLAANLHKTNYIAPVNARPGAIMRDPVTNKPIAFNPQIPEGGTPVFDASGNVVAVRPIDGVQGIIGATAESKARGAAGYKTQQVFDPRSNSMVIQTDRNVVDAANGAPPGRAGFPNIPPAVQQGRDGEAIQIAKQEIADARTPQDRARAQAVYDKMTNRQAAGQSVITGAPVGAAPAPSAPMAAAPPLGAIETANKGAGNLQEELSKRWTTLSDQNREAATTISYLQSIKDLSAKAATGSQSDKMNYVNGLLAFAGSKEKADSVTANDLLKKYSNQIVARLGSGGMGTDAARAILQSAYPNAAMQKDAIHEAADNIIGAQMMTQAKARILLPHANARDPAAYNNTELKFDQNADPRIFQYAAIQDPAARQQFAKKLMQQDPKIAQKMKVLESIGAL